MALDKSLSLSGPQLSHLSCGKGHSVAQQDPAPWCPDAHNLSLNHINGPFIVSGQSVLSSPMLRNGPHDHWSLSHRLTPGADTPRRAAERGLCPQHVHECRGRRLTPLGDGVSQQGLWEVIRVGEAVRVGPRGWDQSPWEERNGLSSLSLCHMGTLPAP